MYALLPRRLAVQRAGQMRGAARSTFTRFEPADIVATMVREKVTMTHMAPTMVQAVLNCPASRRRTSPH